jgi:polyisoprenoid-binding protein YceI
MEGAAPGERGVTGLRPQEPEWPAGRTPCLTAVGWLTWQPKEIPVTTTPDVHLKPGGQPRLAAGRWRVDPAQSQASFTARFAGRPVRGRLPLTGGVLITEPIENSTARLAARTSAVSTRSPALDRLLTGPGFLDAAAFPEISFQSEQLVWVPDGWRVIGHLRVKDTEHELACQLDLHLGETRPDGPPRIIITSSWVIDSRWITSQWIPGLGRRIMMTCSSSLEPDM